MSQDSLASFDIAVIGGGISGLGVCLEASKRGHSVALFEKGDLAKATSSNSLRIIHGGLRYLQSFNLKRTFESIKAQDELLRLYPEMIKPLPCLMPLSWTGFKNPITMQLAGLFYQLCSYVCRSKNKQLAKVVLASKLKALNLANLSSEPYFFKWFDAVLLDPDAFHQSIAKEAQSLGTNVFDHTKVSSVKACEKGYEIATSSGTSFRAKYLVNATGPWLEEFFQKQVSWAKAFNIELDLDITENQAVAIPSEAGSYYFLVPRKDSNAVRKTIFGTFYKKYSGSADDLVVSDKDLDHAISEIQKALPGIVITSKNIIGTDVGLLPAKSFEGAKPILYGSEIIERKGNMIHVLSTKYTTFLSQGRKVLDLIENE